MVYFPPLFPYPISNLFCFHFPTVTIGDDLLSLSRRLSISTAASSFAILLFFIFGFTIITAAGDVVIVLGGFATIFVVQLSASIVFPTSADFTTLLAVIVLHFQLETITSVGDCCRWFSSSCAQLFSTVCTSYQQCAIIFSSVQKRICHFLVHRHNTQSLLACSFTLFKESHHQNGHLH